MNESRARSMVTTLISATKDAGYYVGRGEEGCTAHTQILETIKIMADELIRHLVGEPVDVKPPYAYRLDFKTFRTDIPILADNDADAVNKSGVIIKSCPIGTMVTLYSPDGVSLGDWTR